MAAMVPLASGMQAERKRRGASYKEVAEALKVRQRDIKAIEAGSPDEVDGKVLVAYADWLGMGDSLRQWIANHPKYAAKMGLAKSDTPVRAHRATSFRSKLTWLERQSAEDVPRTSAKYLKVECSGRVGSPISDCVPIR